MAKLILSAFADEYSSNFIEQLELLSSKNIGYIELRGIDGKNISTLNKQEVFEVKKKLNDYNIKVSSIGSPLGKISIEDDFNAHLEVAKRCFETANEVGAENIRIFSFYFPENKTRDEVRGKVLDNLEKMLKVSEEYGVTLCHENEAKIYGESPEREKDLLNCFGGKLKCVFDMGNFVLDGYKPFPNAYELLYENIEYFHIKDSLYKGAIVPAGKGEAQIQEILNAYKLSGGKDTFITLEPHLQTFDGLNALVGKAFENPYKYENQKVAFLDAIDKLLRIL